MSAECVSTWFYLLIGCLFLSPRFQAISKYLPRADQRLKPAIYEMILYEFLKTDYEVQLRLTPMMVDQKVYSWMMVVISKKEK